MYLNPFMRRIHDKVVGFMANCKFVDKYLVASVSDDNGEEYDCIYCTIIRNGVLFGLIGFLIGLGLGWFLWAA